MEIRQNVIDDLNAMTTESWRTIRIMAEMVQALDTLNKLGTNCVSIFGSARSTSDTPEYRDAERLARMLVEKGFGVITGGGPGVMEAANKGAAEAGGVSVGLRIELPHEQGCNQYVKTRCNFRYFFTRKFMFVKYAMAYVVMPGGMGPSTNCPRPSCWPRPDASGPSPSSFIIPPTGRACWNGCARAWPTAVSSTGKRSTSSSRCAIRPSRWWSICARS